ncbi:MAG: response regulator transcription factor [Ignavibacteria bacterium]|nr:response regulator transcription factor [Ignavibacteria bacterium]
MKILIIEDEPELSRLIKNFLTDSNFICETALTFRNATEKINDYDYDVVLLDIMLPDGNGIDLLKEINLKSDKPGILILSAKNSIEDKINGLDSGADDYLPKPFHLPELLARIKSIYRRKKFKGNSKIIIDDIEIDTESKEVSVKSKNAELTLKEFELLLFFLANKNKVITKDSIAEHLWGDDLSSNDNFDFIYQHIKNLRKKISDLGGKNYISTVYGLGYKFKI